MSVLVRVLVTLLTMTIGAAQAFAEQQVTVTTDDCRPQMGVTIGAAANGDRNAGRSTYSDNPSSGALDTAASFELPVSDRVGARLDVGTAAWTFQSRDAREAPLLRDRVRVGRATLSVVKVARCGSPVQGHAGVGFGAYRYHFDEGAVSRIRGGAHVFIGFDVTMGERVAMTTDFAVHAIGGPSQPPVFSYLLWVMRASVGARFRF